MFSNIFLLRNIIPPVVWLTFIFILGISAYKNFIFLIIGVLILLLFCAINYKKTPLYLLFLSFLVLFSGFVRINFFVAQYIKATDFYSSNGNKQYIGTVTDIQINTKSFNKCCVMLKIARKATQFDFISPSYFIAIHMKNIPTNIIVGDCCTVPLAKLKKTTSSWKDYACKESIIGSCFTANHAEIITRPTFSIDRIRYTARALFLTKITKNLSAKATTFFSSLFMGIKTKNWHLQKLKDDMKIWGLSHYLARSGLHLIIVIMVWQYAIRVLPIALLFKQLLIVFFNILFLFYSWVSISFWRAWASFILISLFNFNSRRIVGLQIVALVTLITLIINPMQLFFLDFQLSFGLAATLALFNLLKLNKIGHK